MRKTIITVFAFMVMFGFAVSGAMAQSWTWDPPAKINGVYDEFVVDGTTLNGCDKDFSNCVVVTTDMTETGTEGANTLFGELVDSVAAPLFVVIDEDTVGYLRLNGFGYVALDPQPLLPSTTGRYTHIEAGSDGTLYVIFEVTSDGAQWLLVGRNPQSLIPWTEEVGVKFTPRSLNLGSKGKWVTCKIDEFGYDWTVMELTDLCIVGINDKLFNEPLCVATDGPSNTKNSKKMMVKFDRSELAAEITAELAANPDFDPTSTKITLAFSDGLVNVYWQDTIKTKPAKKPK